MSATLGEAIRTFQSALELSDRQGSVVADRQNRVRDRIWLNAPFQIEEIPLHGSYYRDSQIKPANAGLASQILFGGPALDVDALLILKNNTANTQAYWSIQDGGYRILDDLRDVMDGHQGINAVVDWPTVTLSWSDMKMEVAPAFPHTNGGFLIPATHSWSTSWQWTAPLHDNDALTEANKRCNGYFKPLVKMLKCWNRNNGKPLGSFAVEVAAFHSASFGFQGYAFEIPNFFSKLLEFDQTDLNTPSGLGSKVPIRLNPSARVEVTNAKNNATAAFAQAAQGYHGIGISLLGGIFGKPFPGRN